MGLTRVVVAACSPRMHERPSGARYSLRMNPYLFRDVQHPRAVFLGAHDRASDREAKLIRSRCAASLLNLEDRYRT